MLLFGAMYKALLVTLSTLVSQGGTELNPLLQLGPPGARQAVNSVELWEEKRAAIRAVLDDFLGPFPSDRCPLQPAVEAEDDLGAYRRLKVSYRTLPLERVPAYLLIPTGPVRPRPAVVVLHQTAPQGKDEVVGISGREEMAIARHLVERGYVVLAPDGVAAGERIDPGLEAYDTAAVYRRYPGWNALGIMVWESMRAVDFLCTRPECNKERIGAIGHSHGGYGSIFLGAYDDRVDFDEVVSLIAPRPFLNCSAWNDTIFPNSQSVVPCMDRVRQVYEMIYSAGDRVENIMHNASHAFPREIRARAYNWLDMHLKDESHPQEATESCKEDIF